MTKWNKLKDNKCPKCSGILKFNEKKRVHECSECDDFNISEFKFNEIVSDMYRPKKKRMNTYEYLEDMYEEPIDDPLSEDEEELIEDFLEC